MTTTVTVAFSLRPLLEVLGAIAFALCAQTCSTLTVKNGFRSAAVTLVVFALLFPR